MGRGLLLVGMVASTVLAAQLRETALDAAALATAAAAQRPWTVYRDGRELFWATQF